jgi:hypothetical protein
MANELAKEKITLNRNVGTRTTQILAEGDIIVPDIKPDMAYILKTDASVFFDKTDIAADRVGFSGKLTINALYLAKGEDKPVHSISSAARLEDFVNIEGVSKDDWVELKCGIVNIDYKMLNDRKINYRAVIDASVSVEGRAEYDAVADIAGLPANQLKRRALSVKRSVDNKEALFPVKSELAIPPGKPNIREILQSRVSIANKEVRVGNGRVSVSGDVIVSPLYKGDDDENIIEFVEHEAPFSDFIDISGARENMYADVTLKPSEQYAQAKANSDGEDRLIDCEVAVAAAVKLFEQGEVSVLEDAFIVNKTLNFKKERVSYPNLVCRNRNQCPVKEIVEIPQGCPDILQIFHVTGAAILDEVKVSDDKVSAEGVVETDVLYVAKSDDSPLYNCKTAIPFNQIIETKGARAGMDVTIDTSIDRAGFNMLSDREMEIRFLLSLNASVVDRSETEIITDVEFDDIDPAIIESAPGLTIYVVQRGDTLWSIAKRYNTSIEDVSAINDIEDPDKIKAGQKLIILKKAE